MFDTLSNMQQGDLGEVRAVYEMVKLGYYLSKPMHVHLPYDFIAEKDDVLYKVQVKTSRQVIRESTKAYKVGLCTSGGNRLVNTREHFDTIKSDLLFVMTADDRCWLIPTTEIASKNEITVGTEKYSKYQIAGPVVLPIIKEKVIVQKLDKRVKAPLFTPELLQELLNSKPTVEIGRMYGMSDNGIARWAKKWGLSKPPRGFWQKEQASRNKEVVEQL